MTQNMREIKNQIMQKNILLRELSGSTRSDTEQLLGVKRELDVLLYQYYKALKYE